jgi:hypothetical protein
MKLDVKNLISYEILSFLTVSSDFWRKLITIIKVLISISKLFYSSLVQGAWELMI